MPAALPILSIAAPLLGGLMGGMGGQKAPEAPPPPPVVAAPPPRAPIPQAADTQRTEAEMEAKRRAASAEARNRQQASANSSGGLRSTPGALGTVRTLGG